MTKILIAEDDRFLGMAYRAKFTKSGFEVQIAADGEEALEMLKTFTPDAMLLDLVMPRKDGFTTLAEIRKQEKFKHIPIIVASNLGQKEDVDKATALGANGYIIKSDMALEAIIEKVNTTISQARAGV